MLRRKTAQPISPSAPLQEPSNVEFSEPWYGERELVDRMSKRPGGKWVVAAARLDYENLTKITEVNRLAFGPSLGPVPRELSVALLGEMARQQEMAKSIIDQVEVAADAMAATVPTADHLRVIELGQEFMSYTRGGHLAIHRLVGALSLAQQPIAV